MTNDKNAPPAGGFSVLGIAEVTYLAANKRTRTILLACKDDIENRTSVMTVSTATFKDKGKDEQPVDVIALDSEYSDSCECPFARMQTHIKAIAKKFSIIGTPKVVDLRKAAATTIEDVPEIMDAVGMFALDADD